MLWEPWSVLYGAGRWIIFCLNSFVSIDVDSLITLFEVVV